MTQPFANQIMVAVHNFMALPQEEQSRLHLEIKSGDEILATTAIFQILGEEVRGLEGLDAFCVANATLQHFLSLGVKPTRKVVAIR